MAKTQALLMILLSGFLFSGCKKQVNNEPGSEIQSMSINEINTNIGTFTNNKTLGEQTLAELQLARVSTAKYHDINNATGDGYIDLGIRIQNMGDHFGKVPFDDVFDITQPEIFVYNRNVDGTYELVAVEYAVDRDPSSAPEGFTGDADEWHYDEEHAVWTLHVWIWKSNPEGVFNPTNPRVIVSL